MKLEIKMFMILFFKTLILYVQARNLFNTTQQPTRATLVQANFNDLIELNCNSALNQSTNQSSQMKEEQRLFMFKKNSLLFEYNQNKVSFRIKNSSDLGMYECGFYEFDKFGVSIYKVQRLWRVQLIEATTLSPLVIGNKMTIQNQPINQFEHRIAFKDAMNIFTRNPFISVTLCLFVFVVFALVLVYLVSNKDTKFEANDKNFTKLIDATLTESA